MEIAIKPIVTEKQTAILGRMPNRVGFRVSSDVNKLGIKMAIEAIYGVKVIKINTMNYNGKRRSRCTKLGVIKGKRSSFKKAIVTLKEGDTIDFLKNI